jgi:hypothetical protein
MYTAHASSFLPTCCVISLTRYTPVMSTAIDNHEITLLTYHFRDLKCKYLCFH